MARFQYRARLAGLEVTGKNGERWLVPWTEIDRPGLAFNQATRERIPGLPKRGGENLPTATAYRLRERALRREIREGRHERYWKCESTSGEALGLLCPGVLILFTGFIAVREAGDVPWHARWAEFAGLPWQVQVVAGLVGILAAVGLGTMLLAVPWVDVVRPWLIRRRHGHVLGLRTTSRGVHADYADGRQAFFAWSDLQSADKYGVATFADGARRLAPYFSWQRGNWQMLLAAVRPTSRRNGTDHQIVRRMWRRAWLLFGGAWLVGAGAFALLAHGGLLEVSLLRAAAVWAVPVVVFAGMLSLATWETSPAGRHRMRVLRARFRHALRRHRSVRSCV
jgi:hypothetical protein